MIKLPPIGSTVILPGDHRHLPTGLRAAVLLS